MSELLVKEYRGEILECEYWGHVTVVNREGEVIKSLGDENFITFFRSSAKPIQAIPVVKRGAADKYNFTQNELAVLTGSHRAEEFHVNAVESIMKKIDVHEDRLVCLPTYPLKAERREELIKNNMPKRSIYHNCSGKHMGILTLCRELGCSMEDYWHIDNPAQQEILSYMSEISQYDKEEIGIGTDGCGVPVFAMPLKYLARSYMRMASPDLIEDEGTRAAVERITEAMNKNPKMVAGTDLICTLLLMDDNIVAKGGAKGVYCFGLKKEGLGISIKVMDGSEGAWPMIVISVLEQIGYSNKETIERMKRYFPNYVKNDNNIEVGRKEACFKLI